MSSTPVIYQQTPPPPLVEVTQQAYTTHSGNGSVGPLIAVLAVIMVLGVIAVMVGRLCSGRPVMGGQYDFEGWAERKCATCIDGQLGPPPPRRRAPEGNRARAAAEDAAARADVVEDQQPRREQKPPDAEKNNQES